MKPADGGGPAAGVGDPGADPGRPAADLGRLAAGVRLTPTQRRVLRTLMDHAADAPWLSARELAELAGVSQPSVTRLALVLGFDGYAALREELRLRGRPGHVAGADGWRGVVAEEAERLRRLDGWLPPDGDWADIGAALAASRPLVVVGLRASRYLAAYLAYLARKVHPHVVEVAGGGPDAVDAVVTARDAGATAAVVVCMPRYPQATVDLLELLGDLGCRTVLVTDESMPPLPTARPDWRLAVPVGSSLTFDGHPAALLALGLLLEALCNADPRRSEHRLERLDAVADEQGTYWAPGGGRPGARPGPAGAAAAPAREPDADRRR